MIVRHRHLAAVVSAVALVGLLATAVHAEDGPHDKAIEARQALMKLHGYYGGVLFDMAKGKRDYDAELAGEAASSLAALGDVSQSTLWPEGSDKETPGNAENRALPAIWSTYPEVADKGQALDDAVAKLVPVAGEGVDALKGVIGDVGGACKGCHDDFRAEKDS